MSGLILPGDPPPRNSRLTIIVPRGYESDTPPPKVGECVLCEIEFYDEDEARHHFERNARKHADLAQEARQDRLEKRMPVFAESDPEVAAHMRRLGQRMLREGRLEVRPNERAGF